MKKIADFIKKCLNLRNQNVEKQSIVTRNHAVPYYQNLKEIPWPLIMEKLKELQKFLKKT